MKTVHIHLWNKCYRFKLAQFIQLHDEVKRYVFCRHIFNKISINKASFGKLLFSDKATLHVSEKANKHNVTIWGIEQPRNIIQHVRDSVKNKYLLWL